MTLTTYVRFAPQFHPVNQDDDALIVWLLNVSFDAVMIHKYRMLAVCTSCSQFVARFSSLSIFPAVRFL